MERSARGERVPHRVDPQPGGRLRDGGGVGADVDVRRRAIHAWRMNCAAGPGQPGSAALPLSTDKPDSRQASVPPARFRIGPACDAARIEAAIAER